MQHIDTQQLQKQDATIQAWAYLPDTLTAAGPGPLHGLSFGVKDVIDVRDMPSCYGAQVLARPASFDAACVASLRAAGAQVIGKTVTAEFAYKAPGPTRNPLDLNRTPGGSSSGSAAAVAAGMVDFALGTQTGGSMMRPAAFTGLYGFKPSFGAVHRSGMFVLCDTLDTLGWFTRDVATLSAINQVLLPIPQHATGMRQKLAVMSLDALDAAHPTFKQLLPKFIHLAQHAGYDCEVLDTDTQASELLYLHGQIMHYEMAKALLPIWQAQPNALREATVRDMHSGLALAGAQYHQWQARRQALQTEWALRYAQYDAIITPSNPGPAPVGIQSTGSSVYNRIWSLLGWPSINMPFGDADRMPLGLQLIGRPHQDHELLQVLDNLVTARAH